MRQTEKKPPKSADLKIALGLAGRLNLRAILDSWQPNRNTLLFATWSVMDRLKLTGEEAEAVSLVEAPNGVGSRWDPTATLPEVEFSFTPAEREAVRNALDAAVKAGAIAASSRPWSETILVTFCKEEEGEIS